MADTLLYGRIKPDIIENSRIITVRGKQESALLIILMGSAATLSTSSIFNKQPPTIIEQYKHVTSNKGTILLTVISVYPNDIANGFENFNNYWPESPFIQEVKLGPSVISILTSYNPYVPSTDIISNAFRQKIEFYQEPPFIQEWQINLFSLVFKPVPPVGDLTTQYKRPVEFFNTPYWDKSQEDAGRMVILLPQLAPELVTSIYAGGGKTSGFFFKNVLLGRFH